MPVQPNEIQALSPGVVLPAQYREDKPEKVSLAFERAGEVQALMQQTRERKGLADSSFSEVEARGTDAQAVVKSLVPTGKTLHAESEFQPTIIVTEASGNTVKLTKTAFMNPYQATLLVPGKILQARYISGMNKFFTVTSPAA